MLLVKFIAKGNNLISVAIEKSVAMETPGGEY